MASSAHASGCEFELIDRGRLRVCFCEKCDCFLGEGTYGKFLRPLQRMEGKKMQWPSNVQAASVKSSMK